MHLLEITNFKISTDMKKIKEMSRGSYNEILTKSLNPATRKQIVNLVNAAKQAKKIDEHGNWEFEASFDGKGRGYATNWDLYGYGRDIHNKKLLAVIQIRRYVREKKNWYPSIRKNYFLLGRNEDGSVFSHSVESRTIHAAINSGKEVVKACQDWIFQVDYRKVIRQGDIALVPVRKALGEITTEKTVILQDSHLLYADEIFSNGTIYALNPYLVHQPHVHPDIKAQGLYKIVVGQRAAYWRFAAPTID